MSYTCIPSKTYFLLKVSLIISIPYRAGKQQVHGHTSREPVIKVENNGQWKCLETRDETIDTHKVTPVLIIAKPSSSWLLLINVSYGDVIFEIL